MPCKNLFQRTLSGAIFVAIVISSILVSPWTFLIVFLIISSLAVYEFHKITNIDDKIDVQYGPAIIANGILLLAGFSANFVHIVPFSLLPIYGLFFILVLVSEMFRGSKRPLYNWAYFVLGQALISVPFSLLSQILYFHDTWHPYLLLSIFLIIWINDSFAYLVGSVFGKHRLCERISPKKTWEGFGGGAVAALAAGYGFSLLESQLGWWQWLLFALFVVVFGTLGDLMESFIKRNVGVKDSGHIIPGHGGILDRFDSMLLAVPVIYFYLNFI